MKCPKCDFDNPADSSFCSKCGTQLISSEEIPVSHTKTLETHVEMLTPASLKSKTPKNTLGSSFHNLENLISFPAISLYHSILG